MPRFVFTVTNDLSFDQRMIRICRSLAEAGYEVWLIGRKRPGSIPLKKELFQQYRLHGWFEKGPLFYVEYNLRLFFYLLFKKADLLCAIDLDTILPVWMVSACKSVPRVYDAHELFCEMKEIVSRPRIYRLWKRIESFAVPRFQYGYTVNRPIADAFREMYGSEFEVIRSLARYEGLTPEVERGAYILYQGAVNEGRCFETLIPAMQWVDVPLWICGDGNFMEQAKKLVVQHQLQDKVIFLGYKDPDSLKAITRKAMIGLTLFEPGARSNYYSLANRFFDYMQAGVPQICVDFPVYREINNLRHIAVLTNDLTARGLADAINNLLQDRDQWNSLVANCVKASSELNWQSEEKKLIQYYSRILG